MLQIVGSDEEEKRACPFCEEGFASKMFARDAFFYGRGPAAVEVVAHIPVWQCEACELSFADESAEELRHEAVCEALGVLAPKQIRALRERLGLSQDQFAELTGIGIASIKRWEGGNLIQNRALDNLMKLLNMSGAVRMLSGKRQITLPTFRTEFSDEQKVMAAEFNLRVL